MICYHGHDHPEHCKQCPKEPQKTRARINALLAGCSPDARPSILAALDNHDRAFQEANARESERLQKFIRGLQDDLDKALTGVHYDGKAIMAKLKEIESKIDEGFGGG